MSSMYYLAAPYTDPSPEICASRVEAANLVAAWLMAKHGFCIYSPLTHSAQLVPLLPPELVRQHKFWMGQCLPMVKAASGLIILCVPGWDESKGVRIEVDAAFALQMPIYKLVFGSAMESRLRDCPALQAGFACTNCLADAINDQEFHLVKYPEGIHPLHTQH